MLTYYINVYTNHIFKMLLMCSKNLIKDFDWYDIDDGTINFLMKNKELDIKYDKNKICRNCYKSKNNNDE